jgi:hypothetical protein
MPAGSASSREEYSQRLRQSLGSAGRAEDPLRRAAAPGSGRPGGGAVEPGPASANSARSGGGGSPAVVPNQAERMQLYSERLRAGIAALHSGVAVGGNREGTTEGVAQRPYGSAGRWPTPDQGPPVVPLPSRPLPRPHSPPSLPAAPPAQAARVTTAAAGAVPAPAAACAPASSVASTAPPRTRVAHEAADSDLAWAWDAQQARLEPAELPQEPLVSPGRAWGSASVFDADPDPDPGAGADRGWHTDPAVAADALSEPWPDTVEWARDDRSASPDSGPESPHLPVHAGTDAVTLAGCRRAVAAYLRAAHSLCAAHRDSALQLAARPQQWPRTLGGAAEDATRARLARHTYLKALAAKVDRVLRSDTLPTEEWSSCRAAVEAARVALADLDVAQALVLPPAQRP